MPPSQLSRDSVHFTVWWCPGCGSTQPDIGGPRYCGHCKTNLGNGRHRRGDMERVEVATRDYWAKDAWETRR